MENIERSELNKISYLNVPDEKNRPVPLFPCYHGNGNWELWIPQNNKLIKLAVTKMIEGKYFAKNPESNEDLFLPSINFLVQRAYWKNIYYFIDSLSDDLLNLGTSLKKIEVFHKSVKQYQGSARFVITEMEYIFILCRSLFDLLQEIIHRLWDSVHLADKIKVKKKLPQSFRKMVLSDNKVLSSSDIQQKYLIPNDFANLYYNSSSFFTWMRDYRDNISHSGKSFDLIYHTPIGFAIPTNVKPFSDVNIWTSENSQQNNLGSVKSFIGYIVSNTLNNIDKFISFFEKHIIFPNEISPDYNVYIKGKYIGELISISKYIKENAWY